MAFNIERLMQEVIDRGATDLYLTVGAPPSLRFGDSIKANDADPLSEDDISSVLRAILDTDAVRAFGQAMECNTALDWQGKARFRVNALRQQQHTAIVMRRITTDIPSLESLNLPKLYADLVMEKRGLVLIVGPTGSGKSTSLAAMLEHRNLYGSGHIVTVEDPVEFLLQHKNCIITQRDVGIDTGSFSAGLKNALRQTPDVIVIGEIRDRETMEQAIIFAETGHLCLATLHANNAHQAVERVINFFPEEKHRQIFLNLSLNLKAILSQRLVHDTRGGRRVAVEIMMNEGLIKNLIHEGRVREIRECIERAHDLGMQTFDQALLTLVADGLITEETALAESDNPANLRLALKQRGMAAFGSPFRNAIVSISTDKPKS